MHRVEFKGVTVSIAGADLLADISLQIQAGGVTAVVGANGAGKSTLLKTLCGDLKPRLGEVLIDGRPVRQLDPITRARQLAILSQQSELDFPFLVREVIALGRYPCQTPATVDQAIADELAETLVLTHLLDRKYTSLSGGERQRVHIARVFGQLWDSLDRAIYLFDEPTAALDLKHQQLFLDCLRQLTKKGATVLLSIHDLNLAARLATQMVMLREGKLVVAGKPEEVLSVELVRQGFDVDVSIDQDKRGFPRVLL